MCLLQWLKVVVGVCGCGEWGNTGAHGNVLCKQVDALLHVSAA